MYTLGETNMKTKINLILTLKKTTQQINVETGRNMIGKISKIEIERYAQFSRGAATGL